MQEALPASDAVRRPREEAAPPEGAVTELSSLRDEVIELTQALIRLDTSNPPGAETPAAALLADYLRCGRGGLRARRDRTRSA